MWFETWLVDNGKPATTRPAHAATPRNPWFHPERRIRDCLVEPAADDPDVMLGVRGLGIGSARIASSFFVIERTARYEPDPVTGVPLAPPRAPGPKT